MKAKAESSESRAPFSMLETRMWNDEKFVKLSRLPPSGQSLWIYLLSGPHTVQARMVPGVYVIGRAGIAEALHWSLEEFDACFAELAGRKMAVADWDAQILWLPNVLKRHLPRSPDNVRAWRTTWDLMPDCALKRKIHRAIKPLIARDEHFARAFDEALKPVPYGVATFRQNASYEPKATHKPTHNGTHVGTHKRTITAPMRVPMSDPSDHPKPTHDAPPAQKTGSRPSRIRACEEGGFKTLEKPKALKTTPNPLGNGATAPLNAHTPARVYGSETESPEASPDKARSEFASVLRISATKNQLDLLDDEKNSARKPAPDKDRASYGSDMGTDMGTDMGPAKGKAKSRKAASTKAPGPDTGPTWEAYSGEFFRRYGVQPVRNATVNAQMLHVVERIGMADAPAVARFYVAHNDGYYVRRSHAVGLLLQNAESLRTQWARQRPVTATEAAMIDRTATNANAFAPLIAEARERERNEAKHGN